MAASPCVFHSVGRGGFSSEQPVPGAVATKYTVSPITVNALGEGSTGRSPQKWLLPMRREPEAVPSLVHSSWPTPGSYPVK